MIEPAHEQQRVPDLNKRDRVHTRDFKPFPASRVLALRVCLNQQHVTLRLRKPGSVPFIGTAGDPVLLGSDQIPDLIRIHRPA